MHALLHLISCFMNENIAGTLIWISLYIYVFLSIAKCQYFCYLQKEGQYLHPYKGPVLLSPWKKRELVTIFSFSFFSMFVQIKYKSLCTEFDALGARYSSLSSRFYFFNINSFFENFRSILSIIISLGLSVSDRYEQSVVAIILIYI